MLKLKTRNGITCLTPENESEDGSPKFDAIKDSQKALKYYLDNGYVVLKGLLRPEECQRLIAAWTAEVKPFKGFIYRQASAKVERNIFNEHGFVMNPILNLQSLDPRHFSDIRQSFEDLIGNNKKLAEFIQMILGDKPKIVQSMYFEGNSATWEHQDSYYLDDEQVGLMTAAWIALEDIAADAGRFFVCPKSHLIDYSEMNIENNIATNHQEYIDSIVEVIENNRFQIVAPALSQGDVLLWNSLTIHGSLNTVDSSHSRSSITFHAIRSRSRFNVLRSSLRSIGGDSGNFFDIFRPKDQSRRRNRLIFELEAKHPKLIYGLKSMAIRMLVGNKESS